MLKADRQLYVFALSVCVVVSALLSTTATLLRDRQALMVELDRKRNVLMAFGVDIYDEDGRRLGVEAVDQIFADHIREIILDGATGEPIEGLTSAEIDPRDLRDKDKYLPLYLWEQDGEVRYYAFPISGLGLWSVIYGFIALEDDLATIRGITFYAHGETPGLGAEIEREWWQDQFVGKTLYEDGEPANFRVIKGGVERRYPAGHPSAVDGLSGATVTGDGVARFINQDFRRYNRYFETIRADS
jgi:Na+-transporting NADH:ubiquinone oxidoreductase subunit C